MIGAWTVALAATAQAQVGHGAFPAGWSLLVVDKTAGNLLVLDLERGEVTRRIAVGAGPHEVTLAPDGTTAVVSIYGTAGAPGSALAFVDLSTGAVRTMSTAPYTRPHGMTFVPGSGRLLVTAEAQDALLEVDPVTLEVVRVHTVGQRLPHMVVAAPDGAWAFTANIVAGSFARIDLATGDAQHASVADQAEGIALDASGSEVWVGSNARHQVHVFDAATLERRAVIPTCRVPIRVTLVRSGLMAVTCYQDDRVQLVDVGTRTVLGEVALPDPLGGGAAPVGTLPTPDGDRLFVATVRSGAVHEIDVRDATAPRLTRTFDVGVEPDGMALVRLP